MALDLILILGGGGEGKWGGGTHAPPELSEPAITRTRPETMLTDWAGFWKYRRKLYGSNNESCEILFVRQSGECRVTCDEGARESCAARNFADPGVEKAIT